MMIPVLPFLQREVHLSTAESGLVLAAFPVVALVANLVLGPFIDRYGRRRFLMLGGAGAAICLAVTVGLGSAWQIVVARAVTGAFVPMIGASVFAAVADYTPGSERSRVSGYVTSAAPIAFLCSTSLGMILGGYLSWRMPVVLLAGLCTGVAVAAWRLAPIPTEGMTAGAITSATCRSRLLSLSPDTGTKLLLASYFCWSAGLYLFLGLYPTWLVQRGLVQEGPGTIGAVLLLAELGGLGGALFAAPLSALFRHPPAACALASAGIAGLALALPLGAGSPVFQALAYGGMAFGRDLMLALILGSAMTYVAAARRGSLNASMNAIYQTGATLGGMASAALYGFRPDYLANAGGAAVVFVLSTILLWSITRLEVGR